MAELVFKDDPRWKRDPSTVEQMRTVIKELRDVMKEDLAMVEGSRWRDGRSFAEKNEGLVQLYFLPGNALQHSGSIHDAK